jgi:hypothetical protein
MAREEPHYLILPRQCGRGHRRSSGSRAAASPWIHGRSAAGNALDWTTTDCPRATRVSNAADDDADPGRGWRSDSCHAEEVGGFADGLACRPVVVSDVLPHQTGVSDLSGV